MRRLRRVDRGFWVQLNDAHEDSGRDGPVLALRKVWRGGGQTFYMYERAQWERVKGIVDGEFADDLGWMRPEGEGQDGGASAWVKGELALALDALGKLPAEDFAELGEEEVCERLAGIRELGARLGATHDALVKEEAEGVKLGGALGGRRMSEVFDGWMEDGHRMERSELERRIRCVELLAVCLRDERSYKIVNYRSLVHRMLEQMVWLFGRGYWLSAEAAALRKEVDRLVAASDSRYARKAPDFACGVEGGKLLVVWVRPPQVRLSVPDLDGLEERVALCRGLGSFDSCEGWLVGEEVPSELDSRMQLRGGGWVAKSYEQLLAAGREQCVQRARALGVEI